jgi:hypothetical protein
MQIVENSNHLVGHRQPELGFRLFLKSDEGEEGVEDKNVRDSRK